MQALTGEQFEKLVKAGPIERIDLRKTIECVVLRPDGKWETYELRRHQGQKVVDVLTKTGVDFKLIDD